MKSLEDSGHPAFPTFDGDTYYGMTLRDWFAGMALQGIVGSGQLSVGAPKELLSGAAYEIADAMLKERSK